MFNKYSRENVSQAIKVYNEIYDPEEKYSEEFYSSAYLVVEQSGNLVIEILFYQQDICDTVYLGAKRFTPKQFMSQSISKTFYKTMAYVLQQYLKYRRD